MLTAGTEQLNAYVRANRPKSIAPEDMRAWYENLVRVTPLPDSAKLEPSSCPVPASWIRSVNALEHRVLLYVHGGAYILGSSQTHLELIHRLGNAAGIDVLSVDYRLLPEHAYPACIDDAFEAYRYLLREGFSSRHIAIAGDSAGGGITLSLVQRIRDEHISLPGCVVCFSPWADFTGSGDSVKTNAKLDAMVDARLLPMLAQLVLNGRDTVGASPLFGNFNGLPPLFVQAAACEVLFDDSTRLAARYKEAGNEVVFDPWEGMTHVFQAFPTFVPEAIPAVERAGAFIREKLA